MDEFAHTNAEGSRHVKRYQDVQELKLNAGINVYTTVNVHHIESLNDDGCLYHRNYGEGTYSGLVFDQRIRWNWWI